jgi:hypothetical protein
MSGYGQFAYPTRNFAGSVTGHLFMTGLDVSASLPTSPQGPDHIFLSSFVERAGVWSLRGQGLASRLPC